MQVYFTLPNNYIFSKGTILYDLLELPEFVNRFLEFQKKEINPVNQP